VQQCEEILRAYIQRWSIIKNSAVKVSDERVLLGDWMCSRRPCAWCLTSQLGTPRGRYDECSG
jgi:hypothetical protein